MNRQPVAHREEGVPFLAAIAGRRGFSVSRAPWRRDYWTLRHTSSPFPLAAGPVGFLMRRWSALQRLAKSGEV